MAALDNQIQEIVRIISEQANAPQPAFPAVDWDAYYNKAREQTQADFQRNEMGDLQKHFVGRGINPTSGLATKGKLEASDRVLTPRLAALDASKLAATNNYALQKAQYDGQAYVNRLNALLKNYELHQALADRQKAEEDRRRLEAQTQGGFSAPPGTALGTIVGGSPQPTPGPATFAGPNGAGPNQQIQTGGRFDTSATPGDVFSAARIPFGGGWRPSASGYSGSYGGSPIGY